MKIFSYMFLLSIAVILLLGCLPSRTSELISEIKGTWFLIRDDSVYQEAIFTDTYVWTYDKDAGELAIPYKIEDDSILFYHSYGTFRMKYERVNDNEFVLQNVHLKTHYHKLSIVLDTTAILGGNNEALSKYINELEVRRLNWIATRKNK